MFEERINYNCHPEKKNGQKNKIVNIPECMSLNMNQLSQLRKKNYLN
jgi:hypothetical protein